MKRGEIRRYYSGEGIVEHYTRATEELGLWASEESVFRRWLGPSGLLLELGCGTGRVAFGLEERGFPAGVGVDLSPAMIERARELGKARGSAWTFEVADATRLPFANQRFEAAIFAFNGLMHIAGRAQRRRALAEIRRVCQPGAPLVFTAHDQDAIEDPDYWEEERQLWRRGEQDPDLRDFGDRIGETPWGELFIHVAARHGLRNDLEATGWQHRWDALRSEIATESHAVLAFSDETRFWVATAPHQPSPHPQENPLRPKTTEERNGKSTSQ